MAKWDEVGRGSFGVYQKRPTDWAAIIGGIIFVMVVLGLLAKCAS